MMDYSKISKKIMLKNDYVDNRFSYYKKTIFIILSLVLLISLLVYFVIGLLDFKEPNSKYEIVIVTYGDRDDYSKLINEYDNIDFTVYHCYVRSNEIDVKNDMKTYNVPIAQYGSAGGVDTYKPVAIFLDNYGFETARISSYGGSNNRYNIDKIKDKIESLGWN